MPHEVAGGGIARTRDAKPREIVHDATFSTDAQYSYDGLSRRVEKDLETGTDVLYLYLGWQCIEEWEKWHECTITAVETVRCCRCSDVVNSGSSVHKIRSFHGAVGRVGRSFPPRGTRCVVHRGLQV